MRWGLIGLSLLVPQGIFSKYRKYSEDYKRAENEIFMSNLQYTIIRPLPLIYGNQRDKNIHKLIMIINKYAVIPVVGSGDVNAANLC